MPAESKYTKPRPTCPHPEYWHASDTDSTEQEVTELVAGFVRALQPGIVVETGSAFGQTTEAIGIALKRNTGPGHLWSLEPNTQRARQARKRCDKLDLPVTIVEEKSQDWTPPDKISFAWLDSLLECRPREILHWHSHFKEGAIIGVHDTGPQHEPLRSEIENLMAWGLIRPVFLPTPRGVAFCEVLK